MLDQSFSPKNLLRLMKKWESRRFRIRGGISAVKLAVDNVVDELNHGSFDFNEIHCRQMKKSKLYSSNNIGTVLVQRKINENFRRIYKVKQSNRKHIVAQIYSLISESIPKHIIKLDISSFYENIPRETVVEKIVSKGPISLSTKTLLSKLYSLPTISSTRGLPRGIGLSASLSEYYMRDFDKEITKIKGVYYYARYVDDIVVFCFKNPEMIHRSIINLLESHHLRINEKKSTIISVQDCLCSVECGCGAKCQCHQKCSCADKMSEYISSTSFDPLNKTGSRFDYKLLDYLGYRFSVPPVNIGSKYRSKVFVTISPRKVAKIKSRLIATLNAFAPDNDYRLLRDRLRFITSNFRVGLSGGKAISAGIYYNFPSLTQSSREKGRMPILRELDEFLKFLLIRSEYAPLVRAHLTRNQRRKLLGLSFEHGYQDKILYNFTREKMRHIKEAWRNEQNSL